MPKKVKLISGYKDKQMMHNDSLQERRWETPLRYARLVVEATARRVAESRKLFGHKFYRGDCHSHSQHSDGIGTVAEIAAMASAAELDFQFVTDHWGVTQEAECRTHGLWVGQEPGTQYQHLAVLGLDFAFEPQQDLVADYVQAGKLGATAFIPHPAGWWAKTVYSDEQKQAMFSLPDPIIMEVINGAANVVTAFDYTDQMAVELWDELLMAGRRVHVMGNTDAHAPHGIGIVWSGVFAANGSQQSILKAINAGRMFASEAPLLHLSVGRVGMGGRVAERSKAGPLRLRVVDADGLMRVRIIADGRVRRTWYPDGEAKFEHEQALPSSWRRYVRVEAVSHDGRRGFSNPIYLA